jgi:hypothetical protein
MATALSMPVECPHCGSMHTMPSRSLFGISFEDKGAYSRIWKEIDEQQKKQHANNE